MRSMRPKVSHMIRWLRVIDPKILRNNTRDIERTLTRHGQEYVVEGLPRESTRSR